MSLHDALAVALVNLVIPYVESGPDAMEVLKWSEEGADAILSDPAFREALGEAVAEGLLDIDSVADTDRLWRTMGADRLARALVDRLLPEGE